MVEAVLAYTGALVLVAGFLTGYILGRREEREGWEMAERGQR